MPFPFSLPTTSRFNFVGHISSSTHPSLPAAAAAYRNALYSSLKAHKRLPEPAQIRNYQTVLECLQNYLPYLLSIDAGLSSRLVSGEDIDITLNSEIEVEWRQTLLTATIPGRDPPKIKGRGLDYEIFSVLNTLAILNALIARKSCLDLYPSPLPSAEQRLAAIQTATKSLATANATHRHLQKLASTVEGPPSLPAAAVDVSSSTQSALADLSQAEVELCFVLKDDPYPALLLQSRDKDDREWMVKAPDVPKVRAQVLARLCVSASKRAARAASLLRVDRGDYNKDLLAYFDGLSRTAKAKACRFLGIDADLSGETGKAIAWLRAGMNELGLDTGKDGLIKTSGLSKFKASWKERREDKRIEKGTTSWGMDGGVAEEARILEWLDRRWSKMNDTINVQIVPDWKPLLTTLPTGREISANSAWVPQVLEEAELTRMRAPPDPDDQLLAVESSDEEAQPKTSPIGAFPGTIDDYRPQYY